MSAKALFSQIQEHKEKIKGPHFLFSAENPKFPEKNSLGLDHHAVLEHLKGAGYDAHEVNGHYGSPEKSIVVYGVKPEHAEHLHGLAARLGQDSSIYSTGIDHEMRFHHGEMAGKKITGKGTVHHKDKPSDFFTTLPGGTHHFTHNFDFDKSEKLGTLQKSENSANIIKLVHYSYKDGLKAIDPAFKGTGVDSGVKGRDSWNRYSFFYRQGTEPETLVVNNSAHKYTASIDASEKPLYDIGSDPNQILAKTVENNNGALNMDLVHEALKQSGYFGFYNSKHPQLSNVICAYEAVEVEDYEKLR